jgi:hypothetical protein
MKRTFPSHGIIGLIILILAELIHFKKFEPVYSWFYCFAWWSYILAIDGLIYYVKGNSLIVSRKKEFFLMIPWSIFTWLIFEAANLFLKNWYYINLPNSAVERWLGYAVAYGTVLPGLFETTELLETAGLFRKSGGGRIAFSLRGRVALVFLGAACLVLSVLSPRYFFPLIWVGFIFLLEPFNYGFGGRSLLRDLEAGNPRKTYLLLVAGLICGILWEFWNFWARSKWVYTVPFFEEIKGFEMPYLGFLGFPFFTVQCYVMYNFVSLFRFGRGWEESSYRLHLEKKTRMPTVLLTALGMAVFFIFIFSAIDRHTVESFYVRLSDAYWIEPKVRSELPKVGIATLDDLLARTKEKKNLDELALRLLIPKEDFLHVIEKTELVQLKGLGVKNLRLLGGVGIHSIPALASEDPDILEQKLKQAFPKESLPGTAKLRIWIRAAQKVAKRP